MIATTLTKSGSDSLVIYMHMSSLCGVLAVLLLISFAQRSRYWPCCWLVAFLWPRPATNNHSQCWRSVIFKFYCYDTTIS